MILADRLDHFTEILRYNGEGIISHRCITLFRMINNGRKKSLNIKTSTATKAFYQRPDCKPQEIPLGDGRNLILEYS